MKHNVFSTVVLARSSSGHEVRFCCEFAVRIVDTETRLATRIVEAAGDVDFLLLPRGVAEGLKVRTKPLDDVAHRWCHFWLALCLTSRDCPHTLRHWLAHPVFHDHCVDGCLPRIVASPRRESVLPLTVVVPRVGGLDAKEKQEGIGC